MPLQGQGSAFSISKIIKLSNIKAMITFKAIQKCFLCRRFWFFKKIMQFGSYRLCGKSSIELCSRRFPPKRDVPCNANEA